MYEAVMRGWATAVSIIVEAAEFIMQPTCQRWVFKCLALVLVTEEESVHARWMCRDEEHGVGRFAVVDRFHRLNYANHSENNNSSSDSSMMVP